MRTVYHEAPFHEYAGCNFDESKLIEFLLTHSISLSSYRSLIFDKNRRIDLGSSYMEIAVEQPSSEILNECIDDYLKNRPDSNIVHKSKIHELIYSSSDGSLSLDFLVDGVRLDVASGSGSGDVYTATFKNNRQLEKAAKGWSNVATSLGFEPLPLQSFALEDGCNALKLCTRLKQIGQESVTPYIADTLLKIKEPVSKTVISSEHSRLFVKPEEITYRPILTKGNTFNEKDVRRALSMLGEVKEPRVRWGVEVETFRDVLREYYLAHKGTFNAIGYGSIAPGFGTVLGLLSALYTDTNPLPVVEAGGATGLVVDALVVGGIYLSGRVKERKEQKREEERKARERFAEIAREEGHLKRPEGFCVIASTEGCVLKAAKVKSKETKE